MKKIMGHLVVLFCGSLVAGEWYVVKAPVACLWTEPAEVAGPFAYPAWAHPADGRKSLKTLDTQACYGMPVRVLDKMNDPMWYVELPMQPYFNKRMGCWMPIQGYMPSDCLIPSPVVCENASVWVMQNADNTVFLESGWESLLPFGGIVRKNEIDFNSSATTLPVVLLDEEDGGDGEVSFDDVRYIPITVERPVDLQRALFANAKKFIDMPYCWGGTSAFLGEHYESMPSSVDCSGFIYLLMHSLGLLIPRNAGDQILFSTPREPADAQCGDVFFLKPLVNGNPNHILMSLGEIEGEHYVIEASGISGPAPKVCSSLIEGRFGVPLHELKNGMVLFPGHPTKECEFSCGTFLADPEKLQMMRNDFLAKSCL